MLPNIGNRFLDYFPLQNQTPGFHFPYGNLLFPAFILHSEFDLHWTKRSFNVYHFHGLSLNLKVKLFNLSQFYFLHASFFCYYVMFVNFCLRIYIYIFLDWVWCRKRKRGGKSWSLSKSKVGSTSVIFFVNFVFIKFFILTLIWSFMDGTIYFDYVSYFNCSHFFF